MTFLTTGINPLFIGKPGTGKTFLARAEIHGAIDRAMRRYVCADLLVIDDFAVLAMDPTQAKLAFRSSPRDSPSAPRSL